MLSNLASPGARQQVEQQLRCALKKSHEEDITYIPLINEQYPSLLRWHATSVFCTVGFPPREERFTQIVSIDILDGILDDAPLAVILGGVAWFAASLRSCGWAIASDDEHDKGWHCKFFPILYDHFEAFTDYPLPKLPAQGSAFCTELYFDFLEEFGDEELTRVLKIFAAVAIFLRNKNVMIECCQRCQILYARFFSDTTLSASINELPVSTDQSGIPSQFTSAEFY